MNTRVEGKKGSVNILCGDLIDHASEKSTLSKIVGLMEELQRDAVIFCNFSISGRQIDFLIAADQLVLVIETKGFLRPISGGENGDWKMQLASGGSAFVRNPYLQCRDAALAVKDAMQEFVGDAVPYPSGAVVFAPSLPEGSQVFAGDFKVAMCDLENLSEILRERRNNPWSQSQWKKFGAHLRLRAVGSLSAAVSPAIARSEQIINLYTSEFLRTYGPRETLVHFDCQLEGATVSSAKVVQGVGSGDADMLLHGPSGCGKTLVAERAAVEFAKTSGVPICIRAREFSGRIKPILTSEIGLLCNATIGEFLKAVRTIDAPILFFVDGYNECSERERIALTRALSSISRRFGAKILVTSQILPARSHLLDLAACQITNPTAETKRRIAEGAVERRKLPAECGPLLDAVASGLEAKLVGEVGQVIGPGASRYALFDAYARMRLGKQAAVGIRALSELAGRLCDTISFSLSVRDLDRLGESAQVPSGLFDACIRSNLLNRRGDRVSFSHEMFLDAFSAEFVVRRAAASSQALLESLNTPQHRNRQHLIIGAIDDDLLLHRVLTGLQDQSSIEACLSKQCGNAAYEWAKKYLSHLLKRVGEEAGGVCFKVFGEAGAHYVLPDNNSLFPWSSLDRAFLSCLPAEFIRGRFVDDIFKIVNILDQRLEDEFVRLGPEAREKGVALRSGMFASCYVFQSNDQLAITQVFYPLQSALVHFEPVPDLAGHVRKFTSKDEISRGQLYLLLTLCRRMLGESEIAHFINRMIRASWKLAPYHLRLELMHAICMSVFGNMDDRSALIDTIEGLPKPNHLFLSSAMVDALKSLGALDESERDHIGNVREELSICLEDPHDNDRCKIAFGIYVAQFDHPYASAYCEVVSELAEKDRKIFLIMAAVGANDDSLSIGPLLAELGLLNDSGIATSIVKWARPPPVDSFMPQEAISVFLLANIVLGKLGCEVPIGDDDHDRLQSKALLACGSILHWSNRRNSPAGIRQGACRDALNKLNTLANSAALNVIHLCEQAVSFGLPTFAAEENLGNSLVAMYPNEMSEICRAALVNATGQVGYFAHYNESSKEGDLRFAMSVLAEHGNVLDRELLGRFIDNGRLGLVAVDAMKKIENRIHS